MSVNDESFKKYNILHSKRIEVDKSKRKMGPDLKIVEYGKIAQELEEVLQKGKGKLKENIKNKIEIESKICFIEISKVLFDLGKYEDCIKIDRRILEIDKYYLESYIRLFESYCKIGRNDYGVMFGQMFKSLVKQKKMEDQFKDILLKIDEETQKEANNLKNR